MTGSLTIHRLGIVPYQEADAIQKRFHREVLASADSSCGHLLVLQHPPTITLGRNASEEHLSESPEELRRRGFTLVRSDRGGEVTVHSPGQLVAYPILALTPHFGVRPYVCRLERVVIDLLARYGVRAYTDEGYPGVWVDEGKIAAVGIRVERRITRHGLALNVENDLACFTPVVPCGIAGCRITSLSQLRGRPVPLAEVEDAFCEGFAAAFGDRFESLARDGGNDGTRASNLRL